MPKMPCPTHEPEKYVAAAIGAGALAVAAYRYAPVIREKLGALLARAGAPGAKSKPAPSAINRKDYTPPPFSVGSVYLDFDLHDSCTIVLCKMELRRAAGAPDAPLVLHGEDLELLRVAIDGRHLDEKEYTIADNMLTVHSVPDAFAFMSEVRLRPQDNTQLSGLYRTNGVFCSQCEAEGFRRITYMFDRPDVMTTYRVRVEAEKAACPVLLSNGNRLATGEVLGSRHWALWDDPFPKPSYLFCLVAGDLGSIHDTYTTASGKVVQLGFYSEHKNVPKLSHGMMSLKAAMEWDEKNFGLECDLCTYNVVAVDDYNMGAMENKGLNVFNTSCVLAAPASQTDDDFERVMGVIGHEYFHNWTGNRVTLKDWFQLTLKEGLTVFRDQSFSADMTSAAVKRIEDVRLLRAHQYPEDSGPMAHPIRPESYMAIDNFYTATIYEKGAEVVRMYNTLLTKKGFRKGMDLYFKRHDGKAVECDDFRAAMADANGADLGQFERWYSQAGTPIVQLTGSWDASAKRYTLSASQRYADGQAGGTPTDPVVIPIAVALIGPKGKELMPERVLQLNESLATWTFDGIAERPVLSALRRLSAPVTLELEQSDDDLAHLMAHDTDPFNAWQAAQQLLEAEILAIAAKAHNGEKLAIRPCVRSAIKSTLTSTKSELSVQAYTLTLPSLIRLSDLMRPLEPDALVAARKFVKQEIARELRAELERAYDTHAAATAGKPYATDKISIGHRRMKNICLDYLAALGDAPAAKRAMGQFDRADNMTDRMASAVCLSSMECAEREQCLAEMHKLAGDDSLSLCKWFAVQAAADRPDTLDHVKALLGHPDMDVTNPNKFRTLIGGFARNMAHFHRADGKGYAFFADQVLACKNNPQLAARLLTLLSGWTKLGASRRELMKGQLERIRDTPGLSTDVLEIATRALSAK